MKIKNIMKKGGQIQMSFGMIFSIIVIIAILGVSFYVIKFFINLNKCGEIGQFYNSFENEIDSAWKSPIYSGIWTENIPGGIDEICFGDVANYTGKEYSEEVNFLKKYKRADKNVFIYPGQNACDSALNSYKVKNLIAENSFFCQGIVRGKLNIKISKDSQSSNVLVCPENSDC